MTEQEEEYVHFVSCIEDLNDAWRVLRELKDSRESRLALPAFKYALVAYARPYTPSHGSIECRRLGDACVPEEHLELHRQALRARHKMFAHSDLTVRDAVVHVADLGNRRLATVVENTPDLRLFGELDRLLELIEGTLERMYLEEEILQEALPLTTKI